MNPYTLSFFAQGTPKGQPRPRAFARKFGDKWSARVYDAGTAEEWKSQIATAAKHVLPAKPIEGAVVVKIVFRMPRPKSHYRANGEVKPTAPTSHTNKPDIENLSKAVLDALTALGMWRDDSQVARLDVVKFYASTSDPAGAVVRVAEELR